MIDCADVVDNNGVVLSDCPPCHEIIIARIAVSHRPCSTRSSGHIACALSLGPALLVTPRREDVGKGDGKKLKRMGETQGNVSPRALGCKIPKDSPGRWSRRGSPDCPQSAAVLRFSWVPNLEGRWGAGPLRLVSCSWIRRFPSSRRRPPPGLGGVAVPLQAS